jgi:AcrR family transcriptional regulator
VPSQDSDSAKREDPGNRTAETVRGSREQTTERILDAATELFANQNPSTVTVRQIAEKAGVTHALVHQYVGTKQDLLNSVIQRVAYDRTALVRRSAGFEDAVRVLMQQVLANRAYTKTVVRSALDNVEYVSLKDRIRTGQALVELAQAAAASEATPPAPPRGIDVRVVVAAMSSMAFGWSATEDWAWQVYGLDPADKEDVYQQLGEIAVYIADLVLRPTDDETPK